MNTRPVSCAERDVLLDRFNPKLKVKFRNFTAEEIFYAHQLIAGPFREDAHFFQDLRVKLISFLRDDPSDRNPLSIAQWDRLRIRWEYDFLDFLKPWLAQPEQIQQLKNKFRAS